jgi:hypothetical protein
MTRPLHVMISAIVAAVRWSASSNWVRIHLPVWSNLWLAGGRAGVAGEPEI